MQVVSQPWAGAAERWCFQRWALAARKDQMTGKVHGTTSSSTSAPELDAEVPADAEGALIWASAASAQVTAQQSRIEELLRSQETFVEELFDALRDELGFPETAHSAPQP
jgi:hypothetical protein